jgi:hypothetical protein
MFYILKIVAHGLSWSNYEGIEHLTEFPEIVFNQMFPSHFHMDAAIYKNNHIYLIKVYNSCVYHINYKRFNLI